MHALLLSIGAALMLTACVSDDMQGASRSIFDSYRGANAAGSSLSVEQITLGLKEALNVGSKNVTTQLSQTGGFKRDPKIRIPLPDTLKSVHTALSAVGMGGMTADLETRMNAAAERAAGEVYPLFVNAIRQMTIADARSILSGQQDAATQYLHRTMGAELRTKIEPIVGNALAQAGAVQAYDRVMGQYASLPFMPNVKTDMNNYVTGKAVDGIFYYVAQEEAAIRQNPAKRTSDILRTVFGAQ